MFTEKIGRKKEGGEERNTPQSQSWTLQIDFNPSVYYTLEPPGRRLNATLKYS